MTISNHDMSAREEEDFIDTLEKLNKTGTFLRFIAWAIGSLFCGSIGVAIWVWQVNKSQEEATAAVNDFRPRLSALETRAVRFDASPPVSLSQFHDLDKRLDRMEQQGMTLKEQNALILDTLKRLEGRN
jgi:hypothetical protein